MAYVATCVFREPTKSYYLDPRDLEIHADSRIVAETARGIELGKLKFLPREVSDEAVFQPLRPILRVATDDDLHQYEVNLRREEESVFAIRDRILYFGLAMKPIKCEIMLDCSRMFFFYESEGRVDFRDLLRDVSSRLNVRLQFQQVNAREAAQVLGGVGICGQELCCATWLTSTPPITLKMAKEQGMALTPSKISGVCGRLMCCLRYETDFYRDQNMKLPTPGTPVDTPEGPGYVVNVNVFTEVITVRLGDDRQIAVEGDDLRALREERGEVHACKNSVKNGGSCNGAAVGKSCGTGGCGKDGGCGCNYMKGARIVSLQPSRK